MTLGQRALRVLAAAAGAVVVSWPLAGFTATEAGGARFSLVPALQIGLVVLAVGIAYAAGLEIFARVPRGALRSARAAAGRPAVAGPAALLVVGFLVAVPLFATGSWTSNILEAMVFATIAIGLNISMGMAGLLVLGHAAFWGVGAYTFSILVIRMEWNFWPAFLAGGVVAAGAGLLVGIPAIRLRGDYLAIVTLGFGEAVKWFLKNESRISGGDMGIPCSEIPGSFLKPNGWLGGWLWQPTTMAGCYWFSLGLLAACVACVTLFTRSRFGRALFALREDETAAKCMGVDTVRVKLIAFTASAFWAGLAGAVHPVFRGQITPDLFDFNASVLFVAMVVLGGLGSIPGSIAGAAVLFILPNLLRDKLPAIQDYRMLLFGAVMAAMMVVKPEGLLGARRTEEPAAEGDAVTPVLEARAVTKAFGGLMAVNGVSCSVEPGAVTAIIGPNGAGKTTFFNCITGVAPATGGEILFEGRDVTRLRPHQATRLGMARTFQNIRLFGHMSVLENVVTGRDCRVGYGLAAALLRTPTMRAAERESREKARELLEFVGLGRWAGNAARSLPYGAQRRLEIARALATEPRLLLLDEPAAGMNPRESLDLVDLIGRISSRGLTVVLIEHHMRVVMSISSHVIVLDHGEKIADGTPAAVRADPAVVEAYLGREEIA